MREMGLRVTLAAALTGLLFAQTPVKPDSREVQEHLDKARGNAVGAGLPVLLRRSARQQ
jgi:hypothetical protein